MRRHATFCLFVILGGCGTPSTPEATVTSTAPKASGLEVVLEDLSITIPTGWQTIDFGDAKWKQAMEKTAESNPTVKGMMPMLEAASSSGYIKLVAFDLATSGDGFANNINVVVTSARGAAFAKVVAANDEQLRTMASKGHEPVLARKTLASGQWAILSSQVPTGPNGKDIALQTCLALSNDKVYTITFSALPGKEAKMFDQVEAVLGSVKFK